MNFTMYVSKGVLVVGPHGTLDSRSTGPLCDALVAAIREGWRHVAVDLSALDMQTRAGIRGLIVGAKLMQAAGGELRLCGATPDKESFLTQASFEHLLAFERSIQAAVRALSAAAATHPSQMKVSMAETLTRPALGAAPDDLVPRLSAGCDRLADQKSGPRSRVA